MPVTAPAVLWWLARIIVRIIIHRHIDLRTCRDIAVIFVLEGMAVIFQVVEYI